MKKLIWIALLLLPVRSLLAQQSSLIQFSGVVESSDTSGYPVPFVTVYDANTGLLVMSNYEGFFSLVVQPGDSIRFSSVGYADHAVLIPSNWTLDKLTLRIYLYREVASLPLVRIYPWGSRDNFDNYFVNTPIPEDDYDRAMRNLNADTLRTVAANMDFASVNARYTLNNYASSFYSYGQVKTYAITNPIAWANFLKLVASGGLKRKK